jgi:1-acyl-sn-glycerol-3-phosphate acyltransferase
MIPGCGSFRAMGRGFYKLARAWWVMPRAVAIRELVLHRERAERAGPFILAVSHLSHLEPVFVSACVRRQVRWMARIEHYSWWLGRTFLDACGAFSVDRFGRPGPAVRRAVRLLAEGAVVGMFPEGGCAVGGESVLRGGPLKGGVATISIATGAPVVAVIVLGTHTLNQVRPWLPTKSGRVWMAFGNDVAPARPAPGRSRRALRLEMVERIRQEFATTYQRLLSEAGLRDEDFP